MTATLTVAFVVVFVPTSVVLAVFRRPLVAPGQAAARGWVERPRRRKPAQHARPYARPAKVRSRTVLSPAFLLVAFLALDLLVGAVLGGTGAIPRRTSTEQGQARAERDWVDLPAMQGRPWAAEYAGDLRETLSARLAYEPFLLWRAADQSSTYVNVEDGERRSYEPAASGASPPLRVAFFGGSAMFGIGQRDDHTIPSEVARIAERAGVALEVHNYSATGWVTWQEYQMFDRLLAAGQRFDLAVFYDGYNDYSAQGQDYSPYAPTHYGVDVLATGPDERYEALYGSPGIGDRLEGVLSAWRNASAVAQLLWPDRGPTLDSNGRAGSAPEPMPEGAVLEATASVFARTHRAIADLARASDVPMLSFWQPVEGGWPEPFLRSLPPTTSRDLARPGLEDDRYIDYVHFDEEGARLQAERMWPDIRAALAQRRAAGTEPATPTGDG